MVLKKSIFYQFFFIVLLTTEFYYIDVGGGVARIYHFFAVLVVIALFRSIPRLFNSKVFLSLLCFTLVNLLAVAFSDRPSAALASLLSFMANVAVAMAIALILVSNKIDLDTFKNLLINLTLLSVVWGMIQIVASSGGLVLALSESQIPQIQIGFGPGFRTEANTFGKYMILPILLFLPEYINNSRKTFLKWSYVIFLFGVFMNFTRTAIYGIGIALIYMIFIYVIRGKFSVLARQSNKLVLITGIGITVLLSGALNVSEYATHKLENLFNREEVLEGGSSAYRIEMMELVIEQTLANEKKMIIGNGWGQTHVDYNGEEVQAGGGDLINVFGYAGLCGVILYLGYMFTALISAAKAARNRIDHTRAQFSEGVILTLIGFFFTAQMAGVLIAPEYWLLIGLCIYLSIENRRLV